VSIAPRTRKGSPVSPTAVGSESPLVFLTRPEAAVLLGLAVGTLQNWASARRGPSFHRVGSRVLYDVRDLHAYVAAGRIEMEGAA
jgi:excisionase family DNA binding protein